MSTPSQADFEALEAAEAARAADASPAAREGGSLGSDPEEAPAAGSVAGGEEDEEEGEEEDEAIPEILGHGERTLLEAIEANLLEPPPRPLLEPVAEMALGARPAPPTPGMQRAGAASWSVRSPGCGTRRW